MLNHNNEDTNIILSDSIKKLVNVYYDKETGTYKAELKKKVEIVNEPLSNAIHLIVEKGVLSKCNHLHEDKTEKYFADMHDYYNEIKEMKLQNFDFNILSMGMSGDFYQAILHKRAIR